MTELTPETASYLLNGLLTAVALIAGYIAKNYKPQLESANAQVASATQNVQIASSILVQVKSLVATYQAAKADGTITPEESEKIMDELDSIVKSNEVKRVIDYIKGTN